GAASPVTAIPMGACARMPSAPPITSPAAACYPRATTPAGPRRASRAFKAVLRFLTAMDEEWTRKQWTRKRVVWVWSTSQARFCLHVRSGLFHLGRWASPGGCVRPGNPGSGPSGFGLCLAFLKHVCLAGRVALGRLGLDLRYGGQRRVNRVQ